jgi:glycosyltransferase involved in cell wall biosynthesis
MQEVYRAAHILVYPSFDDCVAAPQIRGVATGLPLVCAHGTGGGDLRDFMTNPDWVTTVPAGDVIALTEGIKKALAIAENQTGVRALLGNNRDQLSWRAYGERYDAELRRRLTT